jgi:succinyl-CoA synthetase beta subunit
MKIHEYQAKALLAAAGAAVPRGEIATTADEALAHFDNLGGEPVVLKAQIHAGGRGKGHFEGSGQPWGGVKYVAQRADVHPVAEVMFTHRLVTKQTGPAGQPVSKVLVQMAVDIEREIYLGMVLDRSLGLPVLMACAEGGVDIEEVAAQSPEKIIKVPVPPEFGLQPFQARRLAYDLGFVGEQVAQAEQIMLALAQVYLSKDCSLAEINPLVVSKQGQVLVLDAKMNFDDNALYRHPDIQAMRDEAEEDPAELQAARANLSFVSMGGNIGCLVNGAGLAMATMDIINFHGGEPANFLDVGGGVTAEGAAEAFRIILADPKVKSIFVNIFGGIAKCDLIASALVAAGRQVGFRVPVIVRLEGTNVEQARAILAGVRDELPMIRVAAGLTEAAQMAVAAAKAG